MKKILSIIAVVTGITLWIGIQVFLDYNWSERMIEKRTAEGWVLVAKQDNLIDPFSPWTWFKQPVVRLAFANPLQTLRLALFNHPL